MLILSFRRELGEGTFSTDLTTAGRRRSRKTPSKGKKKPTVNGMERVLLPSQSFDSIDTVDLSSSEEAEVRYGGVSGSESDSEEYYSDDVARADFDEYESPASDASDDEVTFNEE